MFEGTGVALVTPFTNDNAVDYTALGKIIDNVIEGGVQFLVALGTTAETPTLSKAEKKQILNFVLDHNKGRVPVVVGIGENSTQALLDTMAEYPMDKVQGILSVVPYYNKPLQEGIYQHFKTLASATDLPVILYNVPGRTVTNMLPDTAIRLANEFKNIVAIKEASGNIPQCMELVAKAPAHFTVLSGDDNLVVAQAAIGMKGVISVAANCYAKDFCAMVQHSLKNEMEEARKLHYQLLRRIDLLFAEGNPTGVKYVLYSQGVCENILRLPLVPATEALQKAFASA
ncbi:4-hydroxy-tetrahydrodipicolinate synthase [Taibaiella lutea]|uniref:4-hydroxy-tetrahydrodipicolinate synthase n=1 Tax=Taibaiella lutea TaxID=2608001 RepID=A0A5M6CGS1_9BACT|nr:4-hydroxy-tetrahydrodipicolinate synthase [Taibaiella lutea]KAA5533630.1 4-hydroxy-tetrahydrodipicolinate synthase [Taibaiella lutea]